MSKNIQTKETIEQQQIFILLVLFILSLLTILFLLTKNLLSLIIFFISFNFAEIYYLKGNINKRDLLYSLIKFSVQFVIYTFMFNFFSKSENTGKSLISFYVLLISPIYFTSFFYYNLANKKIAVQDKVYRSIRDIYDFKKENIKFILLFAMLFGIIKLITLKSEVLNIKFVNIISLISYIIITTMTLYTLLLSSKKTKIYKGEYNYDKKSWFGKGKRSR